MLRRLAPGTASALGGIAVAVSCPVARGLDLSFDYTSFESTFGQSQFNVLNYPGINGRYMNTSTDNHRPEMVANGNDLAQFYNTLTDRYAEQTVKNGAAAADVINQYTVNNSTNNGPKPQWIVLNEISSSLWSANPGSPSLSTYRTWLIDCVTRLTTTHGFKVVTLAPFQNPGQNNASWQALSAIPNNYIGIECYLSGTEVWNSGADNTARFNWARAQYAASKQSYLNRGVPANKLFLTEHFANNDSTFTTVNGDVQPTHWGRSGLASADAWDQVIQIRQDAILDVGFDGFLAYNWGGNGMGVSQAEQIQHEYYYRTRRVLASQQPQWLSDSAINVNGTVIPLSWSQPLNWLGDVPNSAGAVANFYRTNTASRTITLDGNRSVGTLTFNSPSSYTIAPGTGGTLSLDNGAGAAHVVVSQGTHTVSANVQLQSAAAFDVNSGTLNLSGVVSGAGNLSKNGAGTLALNNSVNTFTGVTTINGGVLTVTADTSLGPAPATFKANAITLNGGTWRNVGSSAITIANNRGITVLAGGGTLDFSSSSGVPALNSKISGSGTLTKMGTKTVMISNDSSATFSGNWLIKQGRVNVNTIGTTNSLGTGSISLAAANGDVAQLGIGGSGGITATLGNSISLSSTGNGQNSFEINTNNTLTLTGVISGSGKLQKSGGSSSGTQGGTPLVTPGTLILTADNTYTGGTTVNAGTLISHKGFDGNGPLVIAAGANAVVPAASASLYNPAANQFPSGSDASSSRVSSLAISPSGQLDLGNSDMAIDYSGVTSSLNNVRALLASGYNGGAWNGAGIISSTALATDPFTFALGYAENSALPVPFDDFAAQDVDDTSVLIKFTWIGDVTLDGILDFQDLSIFNGNYDSGATTGRLWSDGDFNYDGRLDFQDLSLFNGTYDPGKPSLPEPAHFAGLLLVAAGLGSRHRCRPPAKNPLT